MAYDVVPALDALKAVGINLKGWLVQMAKSKTVWFASAVTVFGAIETYLPAMQNMIPANWYGPILTGVGITAAVLRFMTTQAISEK